MFDPKMIADEADVIIDGFAFIKKDEGRITTVQLMLSAISSMQRARSHQNTGRWQEMCLVR